MNKRISLILYILGLFFILFYSPKPVEAYVCPVGYYCDTSGVGGYNFYWVKTDGPCIQLSSIYACSGTSSSCTGEGCNWGYENQQDCIAGVNWLVAVKVQSVSQVIVTAALTLALRDIAKR